MPIVTSLEWSSLRQCIERLRELVDPRLIGSGKAFRVTPARLADRDPPSLRIDEIGPLTHGDERRQDTEERRQTRLVLAERIGFADRRFGGRRRLRALERRVGGRVTRTRREGEDQTQQEAEPFAVTKFHGSVLGRYELIGKIVMKLILACLALVAPLSSAVAAEATYRCADGTAVQAVFRARVPAGSVRLTFAGQGRPVTLPQVLSADGGRYADGNMEFWIKGKTARLTRVGATMECETR